jgi:hypothetical protein
MTNRVHKFKAASAAREDIVIEFDDGRTYTFPGDVNADGFLNFALEYGKDADSDNMPVQVLLPMLEMLLGAGQLATIRKEVSLSELLMISRTLWVEYMGIVGVLGQLDDDESDGGEGKPPSDSATS